MPCERRLLRYDVVARAIRNILPYASHTGFADASTELASDYAPEPLPLLLALNQRCAAAEREGRPIAGPGLPPVA